jgi:hypothetical protein
MRRLKRWILIPALGVCLFLPKPATADIFGGDVVVLTQILVQAIQQLAQLRQIFVNGQDTLGLLHDINSGIRDGLSVIQIINPKFNPGMYGNLDQPEGVLRMIQDLYGKIPDTADARLQASQDQSVAESLAMHGNLYRYADQVDAESQRMLNHAQVVSPQGAGKLQAQSLAVLIGVTTQVLRTNSAMLKLMAENMALSNRREKLNAEQFRMQYDGLGSAFSNLPTETRLPTLKSSN